VGLRGGKFSYTQNGNQIHYTLNGVLWITDVTFSGTIDWDYGTGATAAALAVSGTATDPGRLQATWNNVEPRALATIGGQIGGRPVSATMYAP